MPKHDGGPAFPSVCEGVDRVEPGAEIGMSLRAYFAGEAMKGLLAGGAHGPFQFTGTTSLVDLSVVLADELLERLARDTP